MAMNLLLESLARCLNGTSNANGVAGPNNGGGGDPFGDDDCGDEPAEVQVRLRDHNRRRRSGSQSHSQRRRRSTTPRNRNGNRRRLPEPNEEEEDDEDDMDRLADARRDAHARARARARSSSDEGRGSSSSRRGRRRQRSSPKLTVEERRNDIFRLPSDHPSSRPSSPANNANNDDPTTTNADDYDRSSPRIHMVTPEPHPIGLMCGRASPSVFRRGTSLPSGRQVSVSNLLRETRGLRALCFASPVRDSQEVAEAAAAAAAAAAVSANASGHSLSPPADDPTVDTSILLNEHDGTETDDDPTVNTADYTHATQDDTVASTHYFDAKLAHMVETSPPMPLYRQYEVTDRNPTDAIRQIVETNSHRSIKEAGVDLAGGLINVVRKKWSSPERRRAAAPQSQSQSRPQAQSQARPRGTSTQESTGRRPAAATSSAPKSAHPSSKSTTSSSSPSSSPTGRPRKTSSDDPPTPPRHPKGYREEVVVAATSRGRRSTTATGTSASKSSSSSSPHAKLGGRHPSEDSSVPSLEFSRNSSQSTYQTSPSI
mmetsp:Transcript_32768/g.96602  ORF Transcript_32768/g.96602 Transcript_32768/m.96602 type:complete len:543 (+) Transcript_32768:115-1743(+)